MSLPFVHLNHPIPHLFFSYFFRHPFSVSFHSLVFLLKCLYSPGLSLETWNRSCLDFLLSPLTYHSHSHSHSLQTQPNHLSSKNLIFPLRFIYLTTLSLIAPMKTDSLIHSSIALLVYSSSCVPSWCHPSYSRTYHFPSTSKLGL